MIGDNYLQYPRRRYGADQDRYPWALAKDRTAAPWPGGRALACMIVVPIEHHMLNPMGKPFKHPGAMVTPYPDLRHYTSRDYGNRVGIFRIFRALADGHEIAAYGLATDHIHWSGLEPGVEESWIAEVRRRFDAAGLAARSWLSPARQQSFATLDLIAAHGFDICLDWESDEVPIAMATAHGPVVAVPLSNELDDRTLLIDRRQTEQSWADQIFEAKDCLLADGVVGRVLGFTLTPYVAGQPFRQHALRQLLAALGGDARIWSATASEIADAAA